MQTKIVLGAVYATHQHPQNNTSDTTYTPSSTSAPKTLHHLPTLPPHIQHTTILSPAQEDNAQNKPKTTTPSKQTPQETIIYP